MFTLSNWTCVSASLSEPEVTAPIFPGTTPVVQNSFNLYCYVSPTDNMATISAANYFLPQWASLGVGDIIITEGTDSSNMLQVLTVSSTAVTVGSFTPAGTVGTANITNNAVTFAKIQTVPAATLVGNPTGGTADVESITLGNGLVFNGTVLSLAAADQNYVAVPMTLTQFLGMFATPFQIIPAPAAGFMNIPEETAINLVFGSAALAGGGAVGLQYGNAAHLAGPLASATEAATDFTSATANTMFRFGGGLGTGVLTSAAIATAIYISNTVAPFTGGTGDTFVVNSWYRTVAAT